jgi:uncharacterized membrane protein YphA (DoxX/SURF4 family)
MQSTTYEYPIYRGPQLLERLAIVPVLALRVYLASVWLRFAVMKLQSGWLTTNPLRPVLSAVAAGQIPTTVPGYTFVAKLIVATHFDAVLSVLIPCTELAIGIALLVGFAPRVTAVVATALNVNLLLAGIGTLVLDGRMILFQVILAALITLLAPASITESLKLLLGHHGSS